MITPATSTIARIALRAGLLIAALGLPLLSVPAHADAAKGWGSEEEIDTLQAFLLLGGLPLLLFVLICLAVYLPALHRGEDVSPANGVAEDHWLGGPRPGTKELTAADSTSNQTGGARGSW